MKEPLSPPFHVDHMDLVSFKCSIWILEQIQSYFLEQLKHFYYVLWAFVDKKYMYLKKMKWSSGLLKLCSYIKDKFKDISSSVKWQTPESSRAERILLSSQYTRKFLTSALRTGPVGCGGCPVRVGRQHPPPVRRQKVPSQGQRAPGGSITHGWEPLVYSEWPQDPRHWKEAPHSPSTDPQRWA